MKLLPILTTHDGSSARSNLTCKYKCGDACFHDAPNTSKGEYFGDIVKTAMSRRGVLRGGAMAVVAVGAGGLLAACGTEDDAAARQFMPSIDSAIVMHQASSQFADGGEFGLGVALGAGQEIGGVDDAHPRHV